VVPAHRESRSSGDPLEIIESGGRREKRLFPLNFFSLLPDRRVVKETVFSKSGELPRLEEAKDRSHQQSRGGFEAYSPLPATFQRAVSSVLSSFLLYHVRGIP
jgi:hypothetical protein